MKDVSLAQLCLLWIYLPFKATHAQEINENINYHPRFGKSSLRFKPLDDDFCDEMDLHECINFMRPVKFQVSLIEAATATDETEMAINGFNTIYEEHDPETGEKTHSWSCTNGTTFDDTDNVVTFTPTFGSLVSQMTFYSSESGLICGV